MRWHRRGSELRRRLSPAHRLRTLGLAHRSGLCRRPDLPDRRLRRGRSLGELRRRLSSGSPASNAWPCAPQRSWSQSAGSSGSPPAPRPEPWRAAPASESGSPASNAWPCAPQRSWPRRPDLPDRRLRRGRSLGELRRRLAPAHWLGTLGLAHRSGLCRRPDLPDRRLRRGRSLGELRRRLSSGLTGFERLALRAAAVLVAVGRIFRIAACAEAGALASCAGV